MLAFFALVITAQVFCAPPDFTLSAGGGLTGISHWKQAELKDVYKDYTGDVLYSGLIKAPTEPTQDAMRQGLFDTDENVNGFGFHGFFDATYVEVNAAFLWTWIDQTVHIPEDPVFNLAGSETYNHMVTQMYFSIFGKYPFKIGKSKWSISPMVGAAYQLALAEPDKKFYDSLKLVKAKGYDVPNLGELLNSWWIKFGVGADYNITGKLFLRSELLYGLKLPNEYEIGMADYWTENIKGMSNGLTYSLAVGYKIKTF